MPTPLDWIDDALAELDRRGLRRTASVRESAQRASEICLGGRKLVNFGSNDYLGLAADPYIASAIPDFSGEFGWGSGSSPLVSGNSSLQQSLEREVAGFLGTEDAIVFPTGFAANAGTIPCLVGRGDAIFSDALNHASIIDGCRLSGATIHVYRHRDVDHLRELLDETKFTARRLIVTESLFSMDGDLAPLTQLAEIAAEHSAMLMVDEAHATGVFGKSGRGLCEQIGVENGVHVHLGTFSKALGSVGGFVAGSAQLVEWLRNRARTYMFSTAAPAVAAVATRRALAIASSDQDRREGLLELSKRTRDALRSHGFDIGASESQIVPVILGDARRAVAASAELREMGFFVPAIRPPSVPDGQSRLRISLTALHTSQHVDDLIAALLGVAK
jgi:8-amino-7-oxononanoate synthase